MKNDFLISSDQCRIIHYLDSTGSLRKAAEVLNRDVSVLSRQIGQIARVAPLVEKINGKWRVSKMGKKMSNWAADAILTQQKILKEQEHLNIVTTGEFSARVLAPQLEKIFGRVENFNVTVLVPNKSIEDHILSGEADIGLGCGRPKDPAIKFHKIVTEPYIIAASPKLVGKKQIKDLQGILAFPHIRHTELDAGKYLNLSKDALKVRASFNHLSGIRGACLAGLGWAILPRYSIQSELERGDLIEIHLNLPHAQEKEYYGIWWLRDRHNVAPWVKLFISWLRRQEL